MFRDRIKPWSRANSILSSRWASFQINPEPEPTPDPDPPDDDDDSLQIWSGSSRATTNKLLVQAVGEAGCGTQGECWSGLFADAKEYDDLYKTNEQTDSGSSPGRIGRQAVRTYETADASAELLDVFMLAPHAETANGASSHPVYKHLYFAWMDERQHLAVCTDSEAHSEDPYYDESEHRMIKFDSDPQFTIQQPFVETQGKLRVNTGVTWTHVRATLFGITETSKRGTPIAWTWSQPARDLGNGVWEFGGNAGQLRGVDADSRDVVEVFVVGWGLYVKNGKVYAAVTPPLCRRGVCYRPGLGSWSDDPRTALSAGTWSPVGYTDFLEREEQRRQDQQQEVEQSKLLNQQAHTPSLKQELLED